eukprot:TRINITY_DN3843_c0_g1_i4.p1 TRINITY_DN3843_c0_g1~~TRINITY_DN3843_c0_g1_i4.p1  ORF type:complete len:121 (-),score=23.31 TRINITY_DN3843_c0_g1_i4:62-424(-)
MVMSFLELKDTEGISVLPPDTANASLFGIKVTMNNGEIIHLYTTDEIKRKKWIENLLKTMNDAIYNADSFNKNSSLRVKRKEAQEESKAESLIQEDAKEKEDQDQKKLSNFDYFRRQTIS